MDRRDGLLVGDRFAARARGRDRLDSIDEWIHRAFAGNDRRQNLSTRISDYPECAIWETRCGDAQSSK
jgi:hypothetical protein